MPSNMPYWRSPECANLYHTRCHTTWEDTGQEPHLCYCWCHSTEGHIEDGTMRDQLKLWEELS